MTVAPVQIVADLPATLILWDIDHTLIENGGVSKETYARAFQLLTGSPPTVRPQTDGRTDFQIMQELLSANSVRPTRRLDISHFEIALVRAMKENSPKLPHRGWVLPGAVAALTTLGKVTSVIQSVLTGNIAPNAFSKLHAFGLDSLVDLDAGGYGSDNIVRSKLVDAARAKVLAKYGRSFDRSSTILIGDTPRDVQAAHDGGAKVIAVATGVSNVRTLSDAGADAALEDLEDLRKFLSTVVTVRSKP